MIRRDFIKNLGLLGVATATPTAILHASEKSDIENTVKGRVKSLNNGIANVQVTDGYTVVLTNAKGDFSIDVNKSARFVYITLPSGYQIPVENGVAQFYKPIDFAQQQQIIDFDLQKLKINDHQHGFVVWADTQILSKEDAHLLKTQSAPDLKALKESLPKDYPLHGIGCGDLVWDKFELFPDYKEALMMTGVPFFNVIGNHDMDINSRTDDCSTETFQDNFGPTYYSFNRGKAHYVVLDDVFFIGVNKKYIGYISENQFSWLEKDLKNVPKGSLVIVSLHIPTNTGNVKRNQLKEEPLGGTVSNRKKLYELLTGYNVHIMSGHTHFNEVWTENNITEHIHGTVCGAWWTGPICSDGTPNGYGYYTVDGDQISWQYKSTGKDLDHQLRIYPKGTPNTKDDEMIVNIWNWDKSWKTEWFEDGASKGSLTKEMGVDPLAVSLFKGNTLPSKHPFVEPTLTDHLFSLKPSANAKQIKVVATDGFGRKYFAEQSM